MLLYLLHTFLHLEIRDLCPLSDEIVLHHLAFLESHPALHLVHAESASLALGNLDSLLKGLALTPKIDDLLLGRRMSHLLVHHENHLFSPVQFLGDVFHIYYLYFLIQVNHLQNELLFPPLNRLLDRLIQEIYSPIVLAVVVLLFLHRQVDFSQVEVRDALRNDWSFGLQLFLGLL